MTDDCAAADRVNRFCVLLVMCVGDLCRSVDETGVELRTLLDAEQAQRPLLDTLPAMDLLTAADLAAFVRGVAYRAVMVALAYAEPYSGSYEPSMVDALEQVSLRHPGLAARIEAVVTGGW